MEPTQSVAPTASAFAFCCADWYRPLSELHNDGIINPQPLQQQMLRCTAPRQQQRKLTIASPCVLSTYCFPVHVLSYTALLLSLLQ
jgi:hypothetical protein